MTLATKINPAASITPTKAAAQEGVSSSACLPQVSTCKQTPQSSGHLITHCHRRQQFFTPALSHIWPHVCEIRCSTSLKICSGGWHVTLYMLVLTNKPICSKTYLLLGPLKVTATRPRKSGNWGKWGKMLNEGAAAARIY